MWLWHFWGSMLHGLSNYVACQDIMILAESYWVQVSCFLGNMFLSSKTWYNKYDKQCRFSFALNIAVQEGIHCSIPIASLLVCMRLRPSTLGPASFWTSHQQHVGFCTAQLTDRSHILAPWQKAQPSESFLICIPLRNSAKFNSRGLPWTCHKLSSVFCF